MTEAEQQQPSRRAVQAEGAPKPAFSYSQGVVSGGLLFVSGQVPVDPTTKAVPDAFEDQVRRVLDNISAIAEAAGARLSDAVKMGVYLADLGDFQEMDRVYRQYFEPPLPARTTVGASLLGYKVEMDAVIAVGR
jgi:2-iminobutanoate/2-iminopropanoate deaminase